jgi:hypothetical protein
VIALKKRNEFFAVSAWRMLYPYLATILIDGLAAKDITGWIANGTSSSHDNKKNEINDMA